MSDTTTTEAATGATTDANITDEVPPEREWLDWAAYGKAARELAQMVADDGYRAETILAVARGGLFCAGSLGYALSIKNIYVMNCEHYTGVGERLPMPVVLPPYLDIIDHQQSNILIVDDVADTGHTIKLIRELCEGQVNEVRTAVLYEKPQSLVRCEYVWKRTDRWINFPWSTEPPIIDPVGARSRVLDA